ncbi:MAG TPA: NUDIX hydrolase [Gemmatimonadales bacterium]
MGKKATRQETSAGGVIVRRVDGRPRYLLILDGHDNWGFPKGHLKTGETPEVAARREVEEETGLDNLILHAPIALIDWFFRADNRLVHKYCHYFLFEAPRGDARPQVEEGITECRWFTLPDAIATLEYDNARIVLQQAAEMVAELPR